MNKNNTQNSGQISLRDSKKLANKLAIKNTAFELVIKNGIDGVTIEDISRRAGVSPRTFFNYFDSKEDAIMQDSSQLIADLKEAILTRPDNESPLQAALRALKQVTHGQTLPKEKKDVLRRQKLVNDNEWLRKRQAAKYAQIENAISEATAKKRGLDGPDNESKLLAALISATTRVSYQTWAESNQELSTIFEQNFKKLQEGFSE